MHRLALEIGEAGFRYHTVAEEGIPVRTIAKAVGRHLGVQAGRLSPKKASKHFGWLAPFVGADNPVSSRTTRERLDWEPAYPRLMVDMAATL